jgi:hypothetical protein
MMSSAQRLNPFLGASVRYGQCQNSGRCLVWTFVAQRRSSRRRIGKTTGDLSACGPNSADKLESGSFEAALPNCNAVRFN